jgi:hypothetical protein
MIPRAKYQDRSDFPSMNSHTDKTCEAFFQNFLASLLARATAVAKVKYSKPRGALLAKTSLRLVETIVVSS